MGSRRGTAVVAGAFFVVAAVTAIAALALYQPLLGDPAYVLGAGADTQVLLGAFLELLLAGSCIGTAVSLHPVVRRQNPGIALGYVCGRLLEAVVIVVGLISVLSVVTLRRSADGADPDTLVAVARSLVALHDWTFLVGPGLVIGVNSLLLAWLMFRSGLVPRGIAVIGLIGGPLVLASSTAVLFGLHEQVSTTAGLAALPVFVWEMSLAARLIAKGFEPSALTALDTLPPSAGRRWVPAAG